VSCAKTGEPILTIYTPYYVFPRTDVPFMGRDVTAFHLEVKYA